jgi:hypothetical protein
MKILALALAFGSVSAFAKAPSEEMALVARALVNNPEIVAKLSQKNTAGLTDFEITQPKEGFYQYKLKFSRILCECLPATAEVDILEDLTPTYHDGAIRYTSSVKFRSGFDGK